MNKYKVAVRTAIEITVHVEAEDEHLAAHLAHHWVEENAHIETWSEAHEVRRLLDDDPVFWAECTDFEMQLEPEDYEVEEVNE